VPSWTQAAFLFAGALLSWGCSTQQPNPFSGAFRMREPPSACRVVFSSNLYATAPGAPSELYCVALEGGVPERLTFCNTPDQACAILEAAPSPIRARVAVRRVTVDVDGDKRLSEGDGAGLAFLDLARGVQSDLASSGSFVSGVDWSPSDGFVVYAATGVGGRDDLYLRGVTQQDQTTTTLTQTADRAERRPRMDRSATVALYERIGADGKGTIWVFASAEQQQQLTQGAPGDERLPGTPYVVGCDADPAISPDNGGIAFRRLTGVGDGTGQWDVLKIDSAAASPAVLLATGPVYRGAADWGTEGIVFAESDPATGGIALVAIDDQGGNRRVLASVPRGYQMSFPRWLPAS
jgi:hypothetical protein